MSPIDRAASDGQLGVELGYPPLGVSELGLLGRRQAWIEAAVDAILTAPDEWPAG